MNEKRAATGFKGLVLGLVTENDARGYLCDPGDDLPYAGSMTRTSKEAVTDLYYDDDLYAQIKSIMGEDVEIRVAEVPLERMAELGLGTYNSATETLEADFNASGKEYSLRFVVDTISGLPYYFKYRVFEITGIRFDNFTTRKDNVSVCEVIITGVFKRPVVKGLAPWGVMQLKADKSNQDACHEFMYDGETR